MKNIIIYFFGILMILGGINHIINPTSYAPMIPDFVPESLANYLSAILEIGIGVGLFIKKYQKWAGLGFMILMIAFLPIHVLDFFKDEPALITIMKSLNPDFKAENPILILSIRLVVQFILIGVGFWIWKRK